jgi:hypothetical protein
VGATVYSFPRFSSTCPLAVPTSRALTALVTVLFFLYKSNKTRTPLPSVHNCSGNGVNGVDEKEPHDRTVCGGTMTGYKPGASLQFAWVRWSNLGLHGSTRGKSR